MTERGYLCKVWNQAVCMPAINSEPWNRNGYTWKAKVPCKWKWCFVSRMDSVVLDINWIQFGSLKPSTFCFCLIFSDNILSKYCWRMTTSITYILLAHDFGLKKNWPEICIWHLPDNSWFELYSVGTGINEPLCGGGGGKCFCVWKNFSLFL